MDGDSHPDLPKYLFQLYLCKAELAWKRKQQGISYFMVQKIMDAEILATLSVRDLVILSKVCFKFGESSSRDDSNHSEAVKWLRIGYGVLEKYQGSQVKAAKADILRGLAAGYLAMNGEGDLERAETIVDEAVLEYEDLTSYYMKLKVLVKKDPVEIDVLREGEYIYSSYILTLYSLEFLNSVYMNAMHARDITQQTLGQLSASIHLISQTSNPLAVQGLDHLISQRLASDAKCVQRLLVTRTSLLAQEGLQVSADTHILCEQIRQGWLDYVNSSFDNSAAEVMMLSEETRMACRLVLFRTAETTFNVRVNFLSLKQFVCLTICPKFPGKAVRGLFGMVQPRRNAHGSLSTISLCKTHGNIAS